VRDGLRLVIYDATCTGGRALPGLSHAWRSGTWLYRGLGRIDAAFGAASWADALAWLAAVRPGERIAEVQYWGHGRWGLARVADDTLDATALEPGHPLHDPLRAVKDRLAGPGALWWWRTCETFGARAGHDFATRWTRFLGCRAAGHTYVIHAWQSGLHALAPGDVPAWSAREGLREGTPEAPVAARSSWPGAPSTVTCFTGTIPDAGSARVGGYSTR
jgi:hypothetical protein